jgi:hypothetical protein
MTSERGISPIWISIVVGVGGFCVGLLSIYLGYELFLAGAVGQFKFSVQGGNTTVGLESVAPGIGFALFGAAVSIYTIRKLMGPQRREAPRASGQN